MADRVIQRNDTYAKWREVNPILAKGEIGIIIDENKGYKLGDGITPWNDLPYPSNPGIIVNFLGDDGNLAISQQAVTLKFNELVEEINLLKNEIELLKSKINTQNEN